MLFTAEDAYEASEEGEPILLTHAAIARICRNHDVSPEEYIQHCIDASEDSLDAATLMGWLGY